MPQTSDEFSLSRPRIGFLGVGWIGQHRMSAMLKTGLVEAVAIADPASEMRAVAMGLAPHALPVSTLDEMLDIGIDGVVIATPSALHAEQSIQALEGGVAVFCQKPLGRTASEAQTVVDAARQANKLLGVDLSYRFTEGMRCIQQVISKGELGRIYAVDLIFHNAYGPDKAWFYDSALSGGGCVMDLGVHLVDLALWSLNYPSVTRVSSSLFVCGEQIPVGTSAVEDYAVATLDLDTGAVVRLACSWNLSAGRDAVIEVCLYGTEGGACLRNVNGSFYDFTAERYRKTTRTTLANPPDDWGGRAAVDWANRLALGERFDPGAQHIVDVSRVLDQIYGRSV